MCFLPNLGTLVRSIFNCQTNWHDGILESDCLLKFDQSNVMIVVIFVGVVVVWVQVKRTYSSWRVFTDFYSIITSHENL